MWPDRNEALTTLEASLLGYLAERAGEGVTREELLDHVWGYHSGALTRAVDHAVKRLRPKIEKDPSQPRHLITVRSVGYRLEITHPGDGVADSFLGRQDTLATLTAHFDAGARLVTLLGPGGVGKTRVAMEYATGSARFHDLTDARDVGDIRRIVGEPGAGLLVLDNFEQLVDHGPQTISVWLQQVPGLKLLVTSRERLALRGEICVVVPPLPVALAADLYLDRAQAVCPSLETSDAIHTLVERLDCLPLAIELAAARAGAFRPEEQLALLVDRFEWLRGGRRDAPSRHATLRATIGWSWDLLDPENRQVLSDLAVFRGGFDLDAAQGVLGPGVAGRLQSLWDRSLVVREASRWRLLESIAAFARERLDGDRREVLEKKCAAWYLAQVELALDGEAWDYLDLVGRNLDNLTRARERCDGDERVRLVLAMDEYWKMRGPLTTRLECLASAVAVVEDSMLRNRLGLLHCEVLARLGRYEEALDAVDRAMADTTDRPLLGLLMRNKGGVLNVMGRGPEALVWLGRAVDLARSDGLERLEASAANNLGGVHAALGDLPASEAHYREAVDVYRRVGYGRGEAMALWNLGEVLHWKEDLDGAERAMRRAQVMFLAIGDHIRGSNLCSLGLVQLERGELSEALHTLLEALAAASESRDRLTQTHCLECIALLHLWQSDLDEAERALAAIPDSDRHKELAGVACALVHELRGEVEDAEETFVRVERESDVGAQMVRASRARSGGPSLIGRLLGRVPRTV